jgi:hypothetical protein
MLIACLAQSHLQKIKPQFKAPRMFLDKHMALILQHVLPVPIEFIFSVMDIASSIGNSARPEQFELRAPPRNCRFNTLSTEPSTAKLEFDV